MNRWALKGFTVLLGLGCTAVLLRVAATLFLKVPFDPNEGWNAYHALAAMSGGALYPPAGSLMFNNYPPLSFYVVGALGQLIGDHIFAGRLISFLAMLGVAGGIFTALRMMQVDASRASFAAILFIAGLLIFTDYVGMDDPQLLAHAIAMGGLLVLLKEPRRTGLVVVATLLLVVAGFIKHNLIALPIALAIWLAITDRRSVGNFVTAGIAFAFIGAVLFRLTYGVSFFAQLNSPRLWSGATFTENLTQFLIWCDVALFGAAMLLLIGRADKYVALCALYAATSVIVGTGFAGGAGVDMNIWFDAAIALALCSGLLLQKLPDRVPIGNAAAFALTIPLLAGLWLNWESDRLTRDHWFRPLAEETASAQADIAFLKSHDGPALCEMLSLCYWASKRGEVDVFNLGQAYATHMRDQRPLLALIEARHFRVLEFDSLDEFALGPDARQAVLNAYRVDHTDDNGVFLLPR